MLFFKALVKNYSLIFCLFYLLFSALGAVAQRETKFDVINQNIGLTSNSVSCILQDSSGFLWIGTGDGLNRYDGVGITPVRFSRTNNVISSASNSTNGFIWIGTIGGGLVHYNTLMNESEAFVHNPSDSSTISDNNISFTHEDKNGFVWVSTDQGGLDKLDPRDKTFKKYRAHVRDHSTISSNQVSYFLEDKHGRIWTGTHDSGLNIFNDDDNKFDPVELGFGDKKAKTIYAIYEDHQSIIWVATEIGLFAADPDHKTSAITFSSQVKDQQVTSIWEDNNGDLWLSADEFLLQKHDQNGFRVRKRLNGNHVLPPLISKSSLTPTENNLHQYSNSMASVAVDKNNNFWMLTANGLDKYAPDENKYDEIRQKNPFNNLNSNSITTIYADASGTLWLGTLGGGINKYVESNFKTFAHKPDIITSLTDARVVSFMENKEEIWVSTFNGGFNKFDRKSGLFERHKIPGVNSIVFDIIPYDDRYFLATYGDGMVEYNPDTETYRFQKNSSQNESSISEDRVQRLFVDEGGNFWVGTANGLNLYKPKKKEFQRIQLDSGESASIQNVFAINELEGRLYLGTLGQGLYIYDPITGQAEHFQHIAGDSTSLSNNLITSIHFDKQDSNIAWMGTYGGGLVRFDIKQKAFEHYSKEDGLPNDVVYGLLEDDKNNLWFSTNAGLSVFNKPLMRVIRRYGIEDGLQANEFNRGAYHRLSDGSMLFGGINGINLFDPNDLKQSGYQAPVVITDFKIFNETRKDLVTAKNALKKEVYLSYDQNFISIEFAVLDYRNVNRNSYAYRLKGLENYWNHVTNDRPFANYTNLDPGDYTFELRATNSEGIWLNDTYSIQVSITPPFWLTWWFKLMSLATAMALIWIVYRIKVRNLKIQKRRLNIEVMKRTQIIQEQNEEIATQNEELSHQNEEILALNESLEEKVIERTKKLEESHQKLIKYALFNSHSVRAPLARLLGLTHLSTMSKDDELKSYITMIDQSAKELDEQIKQAEKNLSGQLESNG